MIGSQQDKEAIRGRKNKINSNSKMGIKNKGKLYFI
jgi:hypothetical protein